VGTVAGGIIGALTNAGVPEKDAHIYAEGVRRGGTLVIARVADNQVETANLILKEQRAVDLQERRLAYEQAGWSTFDETAPEYTPAERQQERLRRSASL
jgi:hypothetical protein